MDISTYWYFKENQTHHLQSLLEMVQKNAQFLFNKNGVASCNFAGVTFSDTEKRCLQVKDFEASKADALRAKVSSKNLDGFKCGHVESQKLGNSFLENG